MNRYRTMLRTDMRRLFTSRMFYIMLGIALAMPIAILVMTSSLAGTEMKNQQTGEVTVMENFNSAWEIIGTEGGFKLTGGETEKPESSDHAAAMAMNMDMRSMCNINLIFFMLAVFVCCFVGDDFRSGYAKNLFTLRAKKGDYVLSKTLVGFFAGAAMLIMFFIGNAGADGLVMCMLAKIFLMGVFAAIYVLAGVFAKKKTWLSILLSLGAGMLLFMMIPMMTPLDSNMMNVFMCLAGGVLFALGIGQGSRLILKKTDLV